MVSRIILVCALVISGLHAQTSTWTGSIDTAWDTPGNWSPATVPTSVIDAVIANVTNQPSTSGAVSPTCQNLTVNAGADLVIASSDPLTVEGPVTLNGTISGGGILIANGVGTISQPGASPYPNINVSGAYDLAGGVTVSGNLQQLAGAGSLTFSGGTVTVNGNASFAGSDVLDFGPSTLHVDGNVSFSTTTAVTDPPSVLEVGGDWDSDANFTPTSGEVSFVGTTQAITATGGVTWFDLKITSTASATTTLDVITVNNLTVEGLLTTTGTNVQIGGTCQINPGVLGALALDASSALTMSVSSGFSVVGGIADLSAAVLTVTGDTTISFVATLRLAAATHTFSGGFSEALSTLTVAGSTFVFDGSGSIGSQSSLPDVDISGTYTLGSSTIAGDLHHLVGASTLSFNSLNTTVTGNALFEGQSLLEINPGGSTLTINGDATMQTSSAVATPPRTIIVDGAWTSDANWQPTSGTVTLTNPAQTVNATSFSTTSTSVGSGSPTTINVTQSLAVTGTLTVQGSYAAPPTSLIVTGNINLANPADTLTLSVGSNEVTGDVSNNGIINGTGTLTMTGTGTVSGSGSYGNLAIDTAGTVTGGNVTGGILGSFDMLAGSFDLAPASTVLVIGASSFSGGVLSGDTTATLDLDGNVLWIGTIAGASLPMIEAGGDWTADENFVPPSPSTVTFNSDLDGPQRIAATAPAGIVSFDAVIIAGNVVINSELNFNAGIISILQGGVLGIGAGANEDRQEMLGPLVTLLGTNVLVDGTLSIGIAQLCLEPDSLIDVRPAGRLSMVGILNSPATICGPPDGNYQVNIQGLFEAINFAFSNMGPTGIQIMNGARYGNRPMDMRAGTFADGSNEPAAVQLSIATDMNMDFRDITFMQSVPGVPEFNVRSSTTTGLISFTNVTGNFAGPAFEDDPTLVIIWPGDLHTSLVSIRPVPGVGMIGIEFETLIEVDVASFHLLRSLDPAGPFTEILAPKTPVGSETSGAAYGFLDSRVLHPNRYHYRLEEQLLFGRRRMLGETSAIPWPLELGNSVFVGNGGLRTIGEGINAAPVGGNVIVAAGTYPAFTTNKPVHILSDGSGPVWIDTRFGKLIVRDIPAGSPDLAFYGVNIGLPGTDSIAGMEIINCDNVIVLDQVGISSAFGTSLLIQDCPQVALQDCRLSGPLALHVLANSMVSVNGGTASSIKVEDSSAVTHLLTNAEPPIIHKGGNATVTELTGTAPRLEFPMLWLTNSTQDVDIAADAGDIWMLLRGTNKDFMDVTPYMPSELYLLLDLGTLTTPAVGTVGSDGTAQTQLIIPDMPSLWGMGLPYQLLTQNGAGMYRFGNVRDQVFMPN